MKAAQNKDYVFRFSAPLPLAATPTLAYTLPDGTTSGPSAMTPAHADVTVIALGADRRTLTLNASASAASLVGVGPGRAWLITAEDGYLGVTIARVDGTTAILGDVLPRSLSLTSSATLSWAGYEYTIPAADTATRGLINTTVAYTTAEAPTNRFKVQKGTVEVVRRPFNSGLTHSSLVSAMSQLADMVPRRQQDLTPQVEAALEELRLYVRDDLLADQTEDDIFNPEVFFEAHRYLAAARVYEMVAQLDVAERMRERALALFDRAMRQLTIDTDDDGIIDSDEINLRRTGGKPTDARGTYSLPSVQPTQREKDIAIEFPRWRGMQH